MLNPKNKIIDSPVLESAWQPYAEFDLNAKTTAVQYKYFKQIALALSMIAVIFAVFSGDISWYLPESIKLFSIVLILILIVNFVLLWFTIGGQQLETGAELRAAAEEIKKEI